MPNIKESLINLNKINRNYLGALDNTVPYLCVHEKFSIKRLFNGYVNNWNWKSISLDEAENIKTVCIMFISYIDIRNIKTIIMTMNKSNKPNKPIPVFGSVIGMMINNIVFLNNKYETTQFDLDLSTHDIIDIPYLNSSIEGYYIIGHFDISKCMYYCILD